MDTAPSLLACFVKCVALIKLGNCIYLFSEMNTGTVRRICSVKEGEGRVIINKGTII